MWWSSTSVQPASPARGSAATTTTTTLNVRQEFDNGRPIWPVAPDLKNMKGTFDQATKDFFSRPLYPNVNESICPLRLVKEQCNRTAHLAPEPFDWLFRQADNKGPGKTWQLLLGQAQYGGWRQAMKAYTGRQFVSFWMRFCHLGGCF